jgi:hypothetical protein
MFQYNLKIRVMITREFFERMEGLTSIKDTNLLVNALARLSKDLFKEGFEKDEIIEYFQKVVEMEVDSALDK